MRITKQHFLIYFSSTFILLCVFSVTLFFFLKQQISSSIHDHLMSLSDARTQKISTLVRTRHETIAIQALNAKVLEVLRSLQQGQVNDVQEILYPVLKDFLHLVSSSEKVHILDMQGMIVASTDPLYVGIDLAFHEAFRSAINGGRYFDSFHFNEKDEVCIVLAAPIIDGDILGVLLVDKIADEVISITQDHSGSGETGEAMLGKLVGDSIIIINPLRFDKEAALRRYISIADTSNAMSKAFFKEPGIYRSKDYRGKEVIAATCMIPGTDWGFVVKKDLAEAAEPIAALKNMLLIFSIIAMLLSLLIAYLAKHIFIKPINALIRSVNRMKDGKLDQRVEYPVENEIGDLVRSFNQMSENFEHKIKELDQYAYVVSHDLKAPIKAIEPLTGMIEEELRKQNVKGEVLPMLQMIRQKVGEMENLINDILESTKMENKVKEPVDLEAMISYVKNLYIKDHVKIFIQQDLPAVIHYHKISLLQILQNLIGNAVKFTPIADGQIRVGYRETMSEHVFYVADNGIGIAASQLEEVFNEFSISHERPDIKSSGIGLSIVKRIVEENEGRIWVESQKGVGTTFYFTIPKKTTSLQDVRSASIACDK